MSDNRNVDLTRCPHPEKARYHDPRDAAKAIRHANGQARRKLHVYRCPAPPRHWHVGKSGGRPKARRRRQRRSW